MEATLQRRYLWLLLFISYSDCGNNARRPWQPPHGRDPDRHTKKCGISPEETSGSRIVGGESVHDLRYPWFAALVSKSDVTDLSVICAGTLISNRHVLTAAHCFESNRPPESLYRVVFNLVNRCNLQQRGSLEDVFVSKVNIHPDFDTNTLRGDIAVIILATPVSIMPVCLPPRGFNAVGEASVIGFGSTRVKQQSAYPCVLQDADVQIFSSQRCKDTDLSPAFTQVPGTFCAGRLSGGVDSCDGDSGGPLQTFYDEKYTIQGVVSFGEGCARENLPGVYTKVSAYRGWIDNILRYSNSGNRPGLISTINHVIGHQMALPIGGQTN